MIACRGSDGDIQRHGASVGFGTSLLLGRGLTCGSGYACMPPGLLLFSLLRPFHPVL